MFRRSLVLLGLVLVALVPASALTAGAASPPDVSFGFVVADPPPHYSAGPVPFGISVFAGSDDLSGEPLELQLKQAGASAFTTYTTTITDGGWAELRVRINYSAQYRWHHVASSRAAEATTPVLFQAVGPRVGAAVNDRSLQTGQRLIVRGVVFPVKPGRIVRLWAGRIHNDFTGSGTAVLLARAYVHADGSYRLTRVFRHPGKRQLFVTVAPSNRNDEGYSSYRHIRVRARG